MSQPGFNVYFQWVAWTLLHSKNSLARSPHLSLAVAFLVKVNISPLATWTKFSPTKFSRQRRTEKILTILTLGLTSSSGLSDLQTL